ncbi:CBS domain-containing protein [Nesterenkonia lutea]|uniref:Transcriptional regulator n=1 Tax=Nesterenkonia lutea TaxID=272919 RepID=A0ABR9JAL5_9MICC|nr:CBS domain-containing protein [Nesterenkonia lutea]MBE1522964.1 putative transcriptional regulator [Nesterenkonia lutea]
MNTLIRDLLRPVGHSVCETQSVDAAFRSLNITQADEVVVRDLFDRPLGFVTREDIERFKDARPRDWARKCCAQLVDRMPSLLNPEDPLESAVEYYRDYGIRPLVISSQSEAVGVLHPTDVFQWCAQHDANLVEELAHRALPA